MRCIPQERLPDELVTEIRQWQKKAKEDMKVLQTKEAKGWLLKACRIINLPQYRDHVTELDKVRLP